MSQTVWKIVEDIGCVGGVEIAVMAGSHLPGQLHIKMLGTFDGITDVGGSFVGQDAERNAVTIANTVFLALEAAAITWEVPHEECDT